MRTELVFILDRSGSMTGLESDTIGGFNAMLSKQKEAPGEAVVTTVLFDDRYELLHDRIPLAGISPITAEDYYTRGSTALLDAVGRTIGKIGNAQQRTSGELKADKVLFVITTDGLENASREFSYPKIKALIEAKKEEGWEFLFMGANIDAAETAASIWIDRSRAVDYVADSRGTKLTYETMNEAVLTMRRSGTIEDGWREDLKEDHRKRGGGKKD